MGSPTYKTERPIPLATFAADVARRRLQAEVGDVPQNAGTRRTESKQALLKSLGALDAKW
jgi:hypothetical protein